MSLIEVRARTLQQLLGRIHFSQEGKIQKAVLGKGAFYVSDDPELLMQAANARREPCTENGSINSSKEKCGWKFLFYQ